MAKHSAAERAIGTPATSKKTNTALNRAAKEGASGATAQCAPPADAGPIPDFLLVKNRKKPTKAEQARIDAFTGRPAEGPERVDWRKPKGLSWEEWDAVLEREREAGRAKAEAKRAAKAENAEERKAEREARPRKPKREDLHKQTDVITVLKRKNPCKPGTAAHAIFACYRSGMTVAQFTAAVEGKCPGKLRPVDYLVYDARKQRIMVGPKPKKGAK